MAQQMTEGNVTQSVHGVIVCIENGPKIMFVDLNGDSSIGQLMSSPKMNGTEIYCGQYVVEGTKASISKIAHIDKQNGSYVVTAKYSINGNANSIYVGGVKLQC